MDWSWSFWRSSSEMVAKAALPCCAPSLMGVVSADLFFCRECSSSMVFAFTNSALSSWFEMSHVLGSANFVIDGSDDTVFITFSGMQAVASSSGLGRGFFEPVSLYSDAHDIFAPLGRGEEDDGGKPQPMLLQAMLFISGAVAVLEVVCVLPAIALAARDIAAAKKPFVVQGRVFCDTCQAGFETPVSTYIQGERLLSPSMRSRVFHLFFLMDFRASDHVLVRICMWDVVARNSEITSFSFGLIACSIDLTGDLEGIEKYSKRTVKVTKQHNEDCKRLLRLMGVPTIEVN
ncbi:hypothetical protein ZIOFF_021919 [Zingiber officinale]|uniref:Uncharacterized protein n=1 Tax=Zingiber officinale TaxID=94328 RepID=A0A8J5H7P2_ZINOF|nr:hypothetical protein ZIOFF_021919 [Zingiber officinale]